MDDAQIDDSVLPFIPDPNAVRGPYPILTGPVDDPYILIDQDLMHGVTKESQELLDKVVQTYIAHRDGVNLQAGDLLLLDNPRAMHGRSQFTPRFDGKDRFIARGFVARTVVVCGRGCSRTVARSPRSTAERPATCASPRAAGPFPVVGGWPRPDARVAHPFRSRRRLTMSSTPETTTTHCGWRGLGTLPVVVAVLTFFSALQMALIAFGNITDFDTISRSSRGCSVCRRRTSAARPARASTPM